ncbi:hypothetical protein NA63_0132 [Flavobacteriaceae bacterium MAR_2010_105]|nr:hypothetical protein NA63_0132 [Flavobacteriaceae bacterium MAR_2010_105]
MKTYHAFALGLILIMVFSCNHKPIDYYFVERQSEAIQTYRQQAYYEYSSRFNDSIWQVLQSFDNNLLNDAAFETIIKLNHKIKQEKHATGCYIIPWNRNKNIPQYNDIIMLEWNSNFGVIFRVFTKSEHIKELLPFQSY